MHLHCGRRWPLDRQCDAHARGLITRRCDEDARDGSCSFDDRRVAAACRGGNNRRLHLSCTNQSKNQIWHRSDHWYCTVFVFAVCGQRSSTRIGPIRLIGPITTNPSLSLSDTSPTTPALTPQP